MKRFVFVEKAATSYKTVYAIFFTHPNYPSGNFACTGNVK